MNKRFILENYTQEIYKMFYLKEDNLSVREYIRELEQLLMRSGGNDPLRQTIACFLSGLNPNITKKVEL